MFITKLLQKLTKNMPNIKKKQFNFKIGADPEFVLTMQNRKVDAKETIRLVLNKKPEFKPDLNGMGFDIQPFGNIGWDGASSTAEIRPNASSSPQEVTNNIGGIFKAFVKHLKLCDMSTISEYSSVGGHIHFEIPKGEKWSTEKANKIHRELASFYLPLLISENKTNLNLRIKQGYGSLVDKRIEAKFKYPDGKPGFTYEFRVPSAEWLTNPKLTTATLAYMGVVYNEIINHPKSFSKFNDVIYKSDKQGDALQILAIMEYNLLTKQLLNKIRKYIQTFEMYEEYKDEISYLFNPKQVIKDKEKANFNIIQGWKLLEKTVPKKSEILATKNTIKKIATTKDFDNLKSVMNVHYNDDTNVAIFAESLKDRIAAYNWKLKNNYYLFGMRKGIQLIIAKNLKKDYLTGNKIIKTTLDKEYIDKLFDKMSEKFRSDIGITQTPTLNFSTGKIKDIRESVIIIGLPYSMRIEENITPFLNFIWTIEKNGIQKISKKEEDDIIDDRNLTLEKRGEIYKILTKQVESQPEIIIDENSHSLQNHNRVIREICDEQSIIDGLVD